MSNQLQQRRIPGTFPVAALLVPFTFNRPVLEVSQLYNTRRNDSAQACFRQSCTGLSVVSTVDVPAYSDTCSRREHGQCLPRFGKVTSTAPCDLPQLLHRLAALCTSCNMQTHSSKHYQASVQVQRISKALQVSIYAAKGLQMFRLSPSCSAASP